MQTTPSQVIKKQRPIFAKEGSQTVRYEVSDNFLRFWFRYIERNRSLIELGNFEGLSKLITADYPTYDNKKAYIAEVKRLRKNFKPQLLEAKIEVLKTKILNNYEVESCCLDLEDMQCAVGICS